MPADLSLMDIRFLRAHGPQSPVMQIALDAAEAHLDEPTRLASARQEGRQEGYREGVEAAARWHDARAAQWDGRGETEQARWERVTAAQVRSLPGALSPAPAEPSAPVAENAALRESLGVILDRYVGVLDVGAGNYDGRAHAESLPEVRRARALLQGQGGGDAATV